MTNACSMRRVRRVCAIAIALTLLSTIPAAGALASTSATLTTVTGANWSGLSWGASALASPFLGFPAGAQVRRSGGAFIAAKKPISAASAFSIPAATKCLSGRGLTIKLRTVPHVTWVALNINVNGRHFKTIKRSQLSKPVNLTGLPTSKFVLSIKASAADGRSVTATRTYRPCATKQPPPPPAAQTLTVTLAGSGSGSVSGGGIVCPTACSHSFASGTAVTLTASPGSGSSFGGWSGGGCTGTGTCTVTMSSDQSVTATFGVSPPAPGSYSGLTHQSTALSFYVSADSTHMQDVSIPTVVIGCTPTNNFDDQLNVASIPIGTDGLFTSTTMQSGVLSGAPATFTYTFSGNFTGTTATGVFREDIVFNDGTSYSCTSDVQSWSVTRDMQGSQAASAPPPGSYSGLTHQSTALSFYVSADSTQMQDVSIPTVVIGCTPTNNFDDQLNVASIPIGADGSFTSTTMQSGVLSGAPATFTYTFTGHFHGTTSSGDEQVGGQLREDIVFNNGTSYSCTSDVQSWSVTRDTQGSQAASAPPPGSYSGLTHQSTALSFNVSADSTQLLSVSIPTVVIGCTPTNSFDDQLVISSIAIQSDGSFTGSASQSGTHNGSPAMFIYTFNGHFEGTSSSGAERVAGQLREDITFNNGTAFSCTSNDQSWSATH